jgi:hypothetical protein
MLRRIRQKAWTSVRWQAEDEVRAFLYLSENLFNSAVPGFSLDILDSDAAPLPHAVARRTLDAAQEARAVFELVERVVLGPEADQHSGWFLLPFGFAQKPREIVLDLG